jgi:glutathione reductase (NADPH)
MRSCSNGGAMEAYDYLVIGGGSGGVASARRARLFGASVVLIERGALGGTCVNKGCIPKKIQWYAADLAERFQDLGDYGILVNGPATFDHRLLGAASSAHVHKLNLLYGAHLEKEGVEVVQGSARFVAPGVVEVGERRIAARHVLIATGAVPMVPDVPGAALGITSDDWFALDAIPPRLLILGGGYVAVEIAGIARSLGSDVTLACRQSLPLARFDALVRDTLVQELARAGIRLEFGWRAAALEKTAVGIDALGVDGRALSGFDAVLWATGRKANVAGLGLDGIGVELDADGFIVVDAFQSTTASATYAVGDVTPCPQLTPVAIAAGRTLADRIFGNRPDARTDYEQIPTVVFTHPPIATVGMTEERARAQFGDDVRVYVTRFTGLYHAVTRKKPSTAMKLVVTGPEERIVGIHAIGSGADELIQGFAVALRMGACKADLDRTMAIHPTAAEELVTLR